MALKIGNNAVANAFVGSSQVRRAYKGGTLVYQGFSPASEQEFIQQEATGGPAQLLKVYGKSIVWNQGMPDNDWSLTNWKVSDNGAISVTNGVARVTCNSDGTLSFTPRIAVQTIANHKYCVIAVARTSGRRLMISTVYVGSEPATTSQDFVQLSMISYRASNYSGYYPHFLMQNAVVGDWFEVKMFVLFDITLLYGAGNEPTSAAQFLADYPEFDPTYDPGSVQSNKTSLLRAYDGGTLRGSLQLNLSTLTGKLNGEGASVVVYPDGLRGVGTDRDAAYGSTGEVARAVVDLGTLNWGGSPSNRFVATLADIKRVVGSAKANILCAKLETVTANAIYLRKGENIIASTGNVLWVYAPSYTDAATFKAAMSGIMLDYPLATPLTYTLDTPLPTDLTCEQGDILQRVSDNNCPFVGEMKFGL